MANEAKNNLNELNNILFQQLRKLTSASNKEELQQEIERSTAVCSVSTQVVNNASLALRAQCVANQITVPTMLGIENQKDVAFGTL